MFCRIFRDMQEKHLRLLDESSFLLQEMMVRLINKISNMCNILYLIFMNLNKLIQ